MYDVVILAGGALEKEFRGRYQVESKAFIPLQGKPMVEYVLDVVQKVPALGKRVLVTSSSSIPDSVSSKTDAAAPGGRSIVESLRSGLQALSPPTEKVLVISCDAPLLTVEALEDFLSSCARSEASLYYAYVSRDDSEKRFPRLRHTYVRLREGVFCGGSLVLLSPAMMESWERLFHDLTAARKNPFALAGILGGGIIVKLILSLLSIKDVEKRISQLLGHTAVGVQSPFAEVAFNVDEMSVLERAESFLEKTGKNRQESKGF